VDIGCITDAQKIYMQILGFQMKNNVSGIFPVSVSMENAFSPQWIISTKK